MKLLLLVPLLLLSQENRQLDRLFAENLAAEMRRDGQPFLNDHVNRYVRRVTARLLSNARRDASVEVLRTPAFGDPVAVASGHLFIPVAFLQAVRDEGKLAGMIPHTIGHLQDQRIPYKERGSATIAFAFFAHCESLVPLALLDVVRQRELDADGYGIMLVASAGFDPDGLRRYLQRSHASYSPYSPLPSSARRLAVMDELLPAIAALHPQVDNGFDEMKAALMEEQPARRVPSLQRVSQ